jgi:hypothetical protein
VRRAFGRRFAEVCNSCLGSRLSTRLLDCNTQLTQPTECVLVLRVQRECETIRSNRFVAGALALERPAQPGAAPRIRGPKVDAALEPVLRFVDLIGAQEDRSEVAGRARVLRLEVEGPAGSTAKSAKTTKVGSGCRVMSSSSCGLPPSLHVKRHRSNIIVYYGDYARDPGARDDRLDGVASCRPPEGLRCQRARGG